MPCVQVNGHFLPVKHKFYGMNEWVSPQDGHRQVERTGELEAKEPGPRRRVRPAGQDWPTLLSTDSTFGV